MPSIQLTLVRIVLFSATIPYWLWLARQRLSPMAIFLCVIVGVAAMYPVVWLGRKLLDVKPTQERMQWITTGVHFLLMLFLGTSLVVAMLTAEQWRGLVIPIDPGISYLVMAMTGLAAFATVINLALRGVGAPFAIALTQRLATEWMYAWTRNPMVLTTMAFLVCFGLWKQSALFVAWVLLWMVPAFVFFLKIYEERELEIRLGKPYLEYRERTPFMWPRRPKA